VKLKRPTDRTYTASSESPPDYLEAVYGDPEVTKAWSRVAARYQELCPDLTDKDLDPRGDPRRRTALSGKIGSDDDPELARLKEDYSRAKKRAMQKHAHLLREYR